MYDLARRAGNIGLGSGKRLDRGIIDAQAVIRRKRLAVPMKHSNAQQVDLKEYQQARG